VALPGETGSTLTFLSDVERAGSYRAQVLAPSGAWVFSADATVEVFESAPSDAVASSEDKIEDLFRAEWRGARAGRLASPPPQGLPGTRWVDTTDPATTTRSANDLDLCDQVTGATRWLRFRDDTLPIGVPTPIRLSLEGSDIAGMLGVFTNRLGAPTNGLVLDCVACAVAGPANPNAELSLGIWRGVDYLVLVDGVSGARGRFRLNSKTGALNPSESLQIIDGRLWLRFDVEPGWYEFGSSPNVATWGTPLIHTNIRSGVFQYQDPDLATDPAKFFRLIPRP
jgi:hypothetical protein